MPVQKSDMGLSFCGVDWAAAGIFVPPYESLSTCWQLTAIYFWLDIFANAGISDGQKRMEHLEEKIKKTNWPLFGGGFMSMIANMQRSFKAVYNVVRTGNPTISSKIADDDSDAKIYVISAEYASRTYLGHLYFCMIKRENGVIAFDPNRGEVAFSGGKIADYYYRLCRYNVGLPKKVALRAFATKSTSNLAASATPATGPQFAAEPPLSADLAGLVTFDWGDVPWLEELTAEQILLECELGVFLRTFQGSESLPQPPPGESLP